MDKQIFKDITYGMYIVTSKDEHNKNIGCVINTLTQITSNPATITIILNKNNYTNKVLHTNSLFSVSILSTSTTKELIKTFGYNSSENIDKFNNLDYEEINNIPIIKDNMCGYIIAEVTNIIDCGTHEIFAANVIETNKLSNITPMTYKYYQEELKGTSPKNAPTYIEVATNNNASSQYRCEICGYIYDDDKEKIKFEDLPEDWTCPLCGAPKSMFKKIN